MNAPETYVAEGLFPRPIARTPLEVQWSQDPEKTFEALEHRPEDYDKFNVLAKDHEMPTGRRKKRYIIIISVAIAVVVALAAGLGKGLQRRKRYESSLLQVREADAGCIS